MLPKFFLRGHKVGVSSIALYEETAISGDEAGNVCFWDLKTRRVLQKLNASTSAVIFARLIGDHVVTHSRDGVVRFYDAGKLVEPTRVIQTGSIGFCTPAFLQTETGFSQQFACGDSENSSQLLIWGDPGRSRTPTHRLKFDPPNMDEDFSAKKKARGRVMDHEFWIDPKTSSWVLAGVSEGGYLDVFSVEAEKRLFSHRFAAQTCLSLSLNQTKTAGVCGTDAEDLYAFRMNSEVTPPVDIRKIIKLPNPGVSHVLTRQDMKIFATCGFDQRLRIFSWKSLKPLAALKPHRKGITCLDFHPTNGLLATGSVDHHIAFYDLYPPKEDSKS